jgi:hypothetical protein
VTSSDATRLALRSHAGRVTRGGAVAAWASGTGAACDTEVSGTENENWVGYTMSDAGVVGRTRPYIEPRLVCTRIIGILGIDAIAE